MEDTKSKWAKVNDFLKGWGIFTAVITIGAGLYIKLNVLTFSSPQHKYETEKHVTDVPNDVEVYKQSVKFVEASEELVKTRDSLTKYAQQITINKKNSEDAIKSRATRDSLLQHIIKGEIERDCTIVKVVATQQAIIRKLDSIKIEQ